METQAKQILEHLRRYDHITSMEAIEKYGVTRLAACIYDLKKLGHEIVREMISVPTRSGKKTSVAKYNLQKEN